MASPFQISAFYWPDEFHAWTWNPQETKFFRTRKGTVYVSRLWDNWEGNTSSGEEIENKKSPFVDKIRKEMIKASLEPLMPVYVKLFNLILQSGKMSDVWCQGLIGPIYESGDKSDPTNYRGICVSSCLGNLFCSILNRRLHSVFWGK